MALLSSALGAVSSIAGASPALTYASLSDTYQEFSIPEASIYVNGSDFYRDDMIVTDISVELTSGFEASVASMRVYNVFDKYTGKFKYEALSKQLLLGASFEIRLGYSGTTKPVFIGFISDVAFGFDPTDLPYIEVRGMDAKGAMMSSSYAQQLKADNYGQAVSEILKRTSYEKMRKQKIITAIHVTDTPDKTTGGNKGETAYTVEMVEESDYEFIVKAAKKFNYEFFIDRGEVYFRKAKSDASVLMELGVGSGLVKFEISYGITGLVGQVEVRAMDPGSGKVVSAKKKLSNTISTGSIASGIVSPSQKVYIDPTAMTQEQADARAAYLAEEISYRLGTLECTCPGIPELSPGRFVKVTGLGSPVDNTFYVTSVVHDFRTDSGYQTKLIAKAAEVQK